MVNVNLDAWNALSPEHQEAIESLVSEMEAEFWDVARAEDEEKLAILADNGITITAPNDDLAAALLEISKPMWDEFMNDVPESRAIIEAYLDAR